MHVLHNARIVQNIMQEKCNASDELPTRHCKKRIYDVETTKYVICHYNYRII